MSLWKNNDGPKSAPVWYARHCVFNGHNISNNKIDLSNSNTFFKTGDAVIYLSSSVITGLTNETVYYIRCVGRNLVSLFTTRQLAKTEGATPISITATEADTNQLFVEYERMSSTNNGTECPALIPVDKATALLRLSGIVSPGWYRYFTYKNADNRDRVHLELLAGVKTMTLTPPVPPTPTQKYQLSIRTYNIDEGNTTEHWISNRGTNYVGLTVTPTETITDTIELSFCPYHSDQTLKDIGFTFSLNDVAQEFDENGYLTQEIEYSDRQARVFTYKVETGSYGTLLTDHKVYYNIVSTSTSSGEYDIEREGSVEEGGGTKEYFTMGITLSSTQYPRGWDKDNPTENKITIMVDPQKALTDTLHIKFNPKEAYDLHSAARGRQLSEIGGFKFSYNGTEVQVDQTDGRYAFDYQLVATGQGDRKYLDILMTEGDFSRFSPLYGCTYCGTGATSTSSGSIEYDYIGDCVQNQTETPEDPKFDLMAAGHNGSTEGSWKSTGTNSLSVTVVPIEPLLSQENVSLSILLKDQSNTNLKDLGFKFVNRASGTELLYDENGYINIITSIENDPVTLNLDVSAGLVSSINTSVNVAVIGYSEIGRAACTCLINVV